MQQREQLGGVAERRACACHEQCGRVAVGEPANLTLIDLDADWVAGERGWEGRSENCCFAGRQLKGRVLLTVAAGGVVYRERAFTVVGS